MEKQRTEAGKKQRGLDVQRQTIFLDQDRHQDRCAEHGEHVLQAQDQHFGNAQGPGVPDGLSVDGSSLFVHGFLLSNTFCPKAKKIPAPEPVKNGDQKRRCPSPASALQPTAYPFPPLIILTYYTERRPALQAAFSDEIKQKNRERSCKMTDRPHFKSISSWDSPYTGISWAASSSAVTPSPCVSTPEKVPS